MSVVTDLWAKRWTTMILGVVGLLAFVSGLAAAGNGKIWVDPDLGRSESEIRAAQEANSKAFFARYTEWIGLQNDQGLDLRSLPASTLLASYSPPFPTLRDAVASSDKWIAGKVSKLTFLASGRTEVSVNVRAGSDGKSGSTVTVELPGGLYPDDDWAPTLGIAEAAPLVFVGDSVIMLVEREPLTDVLVPQMWTGLYVEENAAIRAVAGNPFGPRVETGTSVEFETLLRDEFARRPSTP